MDLNLKNNLNVRIWRNGRRPRLKILCSQQRVGSSPTMRTIKMHLWRNRKTRMVQVHVSSDVQVQLLLGAPLQTVLIILNNAWCVTFEFARKPCTCNVVYMLFKRERALISRFQYEYGLHLQGGGIERICTVRELNRVLLKMCQADTTLLRVQQTLGQIGTILRVHQSVQGHGEDGAMIHRKHGGTIM